MKLRASISTWIVFSAMLSVVLVAPTLAEEGSDAQPKQFISTEGFGKAKWGMTPDQVLRDYPNHKRGDAGGLKINLVVGGRETEAYFVFRQNALVIITARFTEVYNHLNGNIHEYEDVKRALIKTHGKPIEDNTVWTDDLPRDAGELGRAVATGRLRMSARWETDKTTISLRCTGTNYQIYRVLRYESRELAGLPLPPDTTAADADS